MSTLNLRKSRVVLTGIMAAACLLPTAELALATTTTSTFTVSITLVASCTINSAGNLSFGSSVGFLSANIDVTSTIAVTSTSTSPFTIGLDAGTSGGTVTTRAMKNGGNSVSYALYSDSGRTTNWGNTPGTDTVADTGTGSSKNYTVYGRVPPQTTPVPGNYTDTITVTVTY